VITCEGSPAVADAAMRNLSSLDLYNVHLRIGNFDDTLGGILSSLEKLDMVFIDGNHRMEPTLRYFHQMLPKFHEHSIVVFDDIHWSEEMEAAWQGIIEHPSVTCSIDLFFLGFVFFRRDFKVKQHFTIRF
jgi:predicted O-methyltransferase YrrM